MNYNPTLQEYVVKIKTLKSTKHWHFKNSINNHAIVETFKTCMHL